MIFGHKSKNCLGIHQRLIQPCDKITITIDIEVEYINYMRYSLQAVLYLMTVLGTVKFSELILVSSTISMYPIFKSTF